MAHSYDWEAGIEPVFGDEIDAINDKMPDSFPYEVIGIAVGNKETGEAAFFCRMLDASDILEADYLQDVLGDVSKAYDESLGRE